MSDLTVRNDAPAEFAGLPHTGPYSKIGHAFAALWSCLAEAGVPALPDPRAVYYDDPYATPPEALRSHAAVAILPGPPLPEGVDRLGIPGGRVAATPHRGLKRGCPATGTKPTAGLPSRAR